MRSLMYLFATLVTILGTISPSFAARPSIAVLPFSTEKNVVISRGNTLFTGTVEDQTSKLTDELIHQLVASRKFDVLERSRVEDLLQEKEFQESDYASPDEAGKLARLLGADYFVLGRINSLGGSSETKAIPYSTGTYQEQKAYINLYLRIVDARTGRIVAAEKFDNQAKVRLNKDSQTSAERVLLAQGAQDMVGRIVQTVFPLKVVKVDDKILYLNRGNDGSLKVGDSVMIYTQGDVIQDSDNGEYLGQIEREVGTAAVIAVEARFTKVELDSKEKAKEGMLARKLPAAASAKETTELPAGPRW